MTEVFVIVMLLIALWFWIDSMRAREAAVEAARRACAGDEVQFLDETVALAQIWLTRPGGGNLTLARVYTFEFSDTGNNRVSGWVQMTGAKLNTLHLPTQRFDAAGEIGANVN